MTTTPPPSDELRLVPALDWIDAALPQHNSALRAALTGAVRIAVEGPAARTVTFGSGEVGAAISCRADALVRWATQRASWEEVGVEAAGDEAALAIARRLKVF